MPAILKEMTSRQSRSSLGFVADATTVRLSDGSIIVNASSLTATNLQPSTTMKTDASRNIVSADLFLSDIKDYVPPAGSQVFNPLTEDLDADGKDIINIGNLETTLVNNKNILYNQSIANLNMANFNINNVNNINAQTINSKTPLYNPSTSALNMGGFNITNSPTITPLTQKTQFITADETYGETQFSGGVLVNGNITNASDILFENGASIDGSEADLSISVPGIGAITMGNNLISTANITGANITATGVINGPIVGIGNAQPNQTGYNFPITRPLSAGQVMVTPLSSGNTLQFRTANLDGILNQTSILGISTTIANALILGSPSYQMPTSRGTSNQYLSTDNAGLCSFTSFPTSTYGQIARQLNETVGYSLVANIFKNATTLGGTTDRTFASSANITSNFALGTLTYTELSTKTLIVELDLRARIGDAKNATGLFTLNLISGASTILAYDIARIANTTDRVHLSCKIVQPVATGTVFSFSVAYDTSITTNLFLSSISSSVYGAGF